MVSEGPLQTVNEYAFYDPLPQRQYPLISIGRSVARAKTKPPLYKLLEELFAFQICGCFALVAGHFTTAWGSASIAAPHARPFAVDGGRAEGTESRKDVATLEFLVSHHDEVTREPI